MDPRHGGANPERVSLLMTPFDEDDCELDDCDNEDSYDREIDEGETDGHNWTDNPDVPQIGEGWCFVAGA